jgi:hypothetical protein
MYGRFLGEAAGILGVPALGEAGLALRSIADAWQEVALLFSGAAHGAHPGESLGEVPPRPDQIATQEAQAWSAICQAVPSSSSV